MTGLFGSNIALLQCCPKSECEVLLLVLVPQDTRCASANEGGSTLAVVVVVLRSNCERGSVALNDARLSVYYY